LITLVPLDLPFLFDFYGQSNFIATVGHTCSLHSYPTAELINLNSKEATWNFLQKSDYDLHEIHQTTIICAVKHDLEA
jgi:hypothetical protein